MTITPQHQHDRTEAQPTANASAKRSLPKLGQPFEAQPSQYQALASHSAEQPLWLMFQHMKTIASSTIPRFCDRFASGPPQRLPSQAQSPCQTVVLAGGFAIVTGA
jgi:hypothetical protein